MGEVLTRPPRLPRVGWVDSVGLESHAAALAGLAVEGASRAGALALAVRLVELRAPERTATPGHVRDMCARAVRDGVAAVCVSAEAVPVCRECLDGTDVRVVAPGGDELEVTLDAAALLSGQYATVAEEIAAAGDADDAALLTVLVRTDELGCYEDVRRATLLAIAAGADFVEVAPPALPDALCVLEAIRDAEEESGRPVGFKASGCASVEDAIHVLVLVHETLGPDRLTPDACRLAGPHLLDELGGHAESRS